MKYKPITRLVTFLSLGVLLFGLATAQTQAEVADVNANALPATFQNGAVTILFPTASNVSLGGYVLTQQGRAPRGASVTLNDLLGNSRETTVNSVSYYQFTEVEAGRTYLLTVTAKGYNFTPPTAVVTPNFDIAELNFTAFSGRGY